MSLRASACQRRRIDRLCSTHRRIAVNMDPFLFARQPQCASGMAARTGEDPIGASAPPTARPAGRRQSRSSGFWFKMRAPPVQMLCAAAKPRTCRQATAEAALLPSRSGRAKPSADRAAAPPSAGSGRAPRRRSPRSSGWHKPQASPVSPGARLQRNRTSHRRRARSYRPCPCSGAGTRMPERGNGDWETSCPQRARRRRACLQLRWAEGTEAALPSQHRRRSAL